MVEVIRNECELVRVYLKNTCWTLFSLQLKFLGDCSNIIYSTTQVFLLRLRIDKVNEY